MMKRSVDAKTKTPVKSKTEAIYTGVFLAAAVAVVSGVLFASGFLGTGFLFLLGVPIIIALILVI